MDEHSANAKTIFLEAVAMAEADRRAAYLDAACEGDPGLRARVTELLCAHEEAGRFLGGASPGSPPSDERCERPGMVIGPYRLAEEIGEGGFSIVYLAEQQHPMRRRVALKILKPGMDTRRVIARFEAERQMLAAMDHPNIAKVFDAGATEAGRPFFVMELVEGRSITEHCDAHSLGLRERLELFLAVCQAVQHAHQKGIIHRDLKPSNILVASYDGVPVPKVIDFGVSKATGCALTERSTFTQHGQLIGTFEYMSPEQAHLDSTDVDTRSDIYSLGVILYELLTGTTPLGRRRLDGRALDEILRLIREGEPPRPSAQLFRPGRPDEAGRDDVPEGPIAITAPSLRTPSIPGRLVRGDLDWIVLKALEPDRDRRYETAAGLARDLQRYLVDEPVSACPPSVRYRVRKFVRRHRGPVLAASLLVLALVGGIIGTTWGMIRAGDARAAAVAEARQKETALDAARRSERGARDQLFQALLNQARAGRLGRRMGQRLESLAALKQAARLRPDERLRDEAIAAMALPDLRSVPGWPAARPDPVTIAYGRDYRLDARVDEAAGVIRIRSLPGGGEVLRIASGPVVGKCLAFSPDDRFLLALVEGFRLRVWRAADGRPVFRDDFEGCRAYGFSPDRRRLAIGQDDRVRLLDLETGEDVGQWRLRGRAHALAFHPDGRRLAVGYFDADVASVYDSAGGALLADLRVGPIADQVLAWHPDGRRLAVTGSAPRIQVWDVASRRRVATLDGHTQLVSSLSFHPEGHLLASHGWDGQLLLWEATTGRALMRLITDDAPRFSADGRWLGAIRVGERVDLLEVEPGREYRTLVSGAGAGQGTYGLGDISPDGRLLVVGMDEGARLWDLSNGREVAALPAGTIFVGFDGRGKPGTDAASGDGVRRDLLTAGPDGLLRWPAGEDPAHAGRLTLGPPRRLSALERAWFARRSDGRAHGVATVEGQANQLLDLETGAVLRELGAHPRGEVRDLSGDGRWAAGCGWHTDRVRLWDARTGRIAHEWVTGTRASAFFTPDNRALILATDGEFSRWDLATLRPSWRLRREVVQFPGHVAFSPNGRLMALEMAPAVIELRDVADGRVVARLVDPNGDRSSWLGFTPDSNRLVAVSRFSSVVHIWDLRAIRNRLRGMNLDWDWPEFPAEVPRPTEERPLAIEVRLPDRAWRMQAEESRARQSIERHARTVAEHPGSAEACNDLAWDFLMAPAPLRDPQAALPLAEKAARLEPGNAGYRQTLALAYYRAGRPLAAVESTRRGLGAQTDQGLATDLYILALSYRRLGNSSRARDYLEWATRWSRIQSDLDPEPHPSAEELRREAEDLRGPAGG